MARRERVTRVIDGDTFKTASRKNPVRLEGVDTPEKGQPGYEAARRALQELIGGEEVFATVARDTFGRSVAKVKVGGTSVNRAMQRHSE